MILPNFFIVGAPKAGTTTLYDWFRAHPEIYMPAIKGVRFFCYKGQEDALKYRYRTLEEYATLFEGVTNETAIGEATAIYFEYPDAARRIHEVVPEARIIAILREPVQRAFSIYHMNLREHGANEGIGFMAALERDPALRKLYFDGLAPFFERFPRERIRIVLLEDLRDDARATLGGLFEFLGVQPNFVPDFAISNPGGIPRFPRLHRLMTNRRLRLLSRKVLPERTVEATKRLRNRNLMKHTMTPEEWDQGYNWFHDDLLRTQELVGIDLGRWIRA
jgi:hypothetical protein